MKKAFFFFLRYVIAWPLTIAGRPIMAFYHWTVTMLDASPSGFPKYEAPPPPHEDSALFRAFWMAKTATDDPDVQLKVFRIALEALRQQEAANVVFEEWKKVVRRNI